MSTLPLLAFAMIAAYPIFKRLFPRYCIVFLFLFGTAFTVLIGTTHFSDVHLHFVVPHFIGPTQSWTSTFSPALPLVLTMLTGQYLAWMTVLKVSGYQSPARAIITANSLGIAAANCTGDEAHCDPTKRYIAGIANGLFYLVGGLFGGTLVLLFAALPKKLIAVLAGMALLGAIMVNLAGIVAADDHRKALLVTFVATASGMTYLGLGSAFWGIVVGMVPHKSQDTLVCFYFIFPTETLPASEHGLIAQAFLSEPAREGHDVDRAFRQCPFNKTKESRLLRHPLVQLGDQFARYKPIINFAQFVLHVG